MVEPRFAIAVLLGLSWATFAADPARGWGDRTHPAIVRLAIETLPADVKARFRGQSHQLERFSNEPDTVLRRRLGREEAIRHFIDLDGYMAAPFANFPRYETAAVRRIGRRRVEKYGRLPWVILRKRQEMSAELARSGGGDWVRVAGHLAHYVGDGYQPLHLTLDYDGRRGGAGGADSRGIEGRGIHARYENGVVDARIDAYESAIRPSLAPARVLSDAREGLFLAFFRSYPEVNAIFAAARRARAQGTPGGDGYNRELERRLAEMTRRQLSDAATMLGSLWLTAWREPRR